MDVQRYLADEPVLACPPSAGYRLRKFGRRHKRAVEMGAVMTLAILVTAGTLGWAVRDRDARKEEAAREQSARRVAAERGAGLALQEAEDLLRRGKWSEARAPVRRAEGFLANVEPDAVAYG